MVHWVQPNPWFIQLIVQKVKRNSDLATVVLPLVMDKKKQKKPERGIETMFRVASANQQRLSEMADNKAHIMITVNAIILSVIISVLIGRIEEYSQLTIPTIFLLIINVMTLVFAVLATRPAVSGGIQMSEKSAIKKSNMLYFGNFITLK